MATIQESILERLLSDAAVSSLVGDRIYPDDVPDHQLSAPFIYYTVPEEQPNTTLRGDMMSVGCTVEFELLAESYAQLNDLKTALRTSLHLWRGGQVKRAFWKSSQSGVTDDGYRATVLFTVFGTDAPLVPTQSGVPRVEVREDGLYFGGSKVGGSAAGALLAANNLSDVADVPTARNALGLGEDSEVTFQSATFSGVRIDGSGFEGNAATATKLATPRSFNGVAFDGSADVTITTAADKLTGTTLASSVVNSSLTKLGDVTAGNWKAGYIGITSTAAAVAEGITTPGIYLGYTGGSYRMQLSAGGTGRNFMIDQEADGVARWLFPGLVFFEIDRNNQRITSNWDMGFGFTGEPIGARLWARDNDGNRPIVRITRDATGGSKPHLQLELMSDASVRRAAGDVRADWAVSTDGSRAGRCTLNGYYTTSAMEGVRVEGSLAGAKLGFYGANAVNRQLVEGGRGSNSALTSLLTALSNLGLITDVTDG